MDGGIDLHTVSLDEATGGFVVTFALNALHLSQERAEEVAHFGVVVDTNEGLAFLLHEFHTGLGCLALFGLLEHPMGDEGTIAHVASSMLLPGLIRTSCVSAPFWM